MMNKSPLISIIIPVYNVEKYLKECLNSVVNQTYANLEIILVNDGSADKSPQICDEFALQDSRIKVFHQKKSGV
ncbi:MAG: glycosyltransferase, partial [Campylobacter sp.]|nr:glycosyltransferase [Campylobacter sp.]